MVQSTEEVLFEIFQNATRHASDEYDWQTVYDEIGYDQLGFTFLVAILVLVCAWIIFEIFAQNGPTQSLYRQRLFHPKCIQATLNGSDHRSPPPNVRSMFSVVFGAFSIPADKLPALMGPGAHLSYRLMQHCLYFAHVAVVYSLLVLIPMFLSQYYRQKGSKNDLLKMMGVNYVSPSNPSHMWMIVISAYLMAYYWMLMIYSEWQHVKQVRLSWEHDSRSFHLQSHYSLIVERDMEVKHTPSLKPQLAKLLQQDESHVAFVIPVYPATRIWELETRRDIGSLSGCIMGENEMEGIETEIAAERLSLVGKIQEKGGDKKRQANALFTETDGDLKPQVGGLSATTVRTTSTLIGIISRLFVTYRPVTYFVTLKSLASRTVLAHMYSGASSSGAGMGRLSRAPPACDLIWGNVTVERRTSEIRKVFIALVLVVFGITYAIPIIEIQNLARNYNKEIVANVNRVENPPVFSPQWNAEIMALYFPALLQVLLSQLLPILFRFLSLYYERCKTFQEVTNLVTHRAFLFQLLTVYLFVFEEIWFDVTKVSGGLVVFVDSLVSRLRRLGQAIPPVSLYFASTIILNLVTEIAVEVLTPLMLLRGLYARIVSGNKNAWQDLGMVQFRYTSSMTTYLTLLNIMFTFGIIAPVVVFVCWFFWVISYLWNTYGFIYLNNRKYEEATAFCATLYSGISTSLILSQFALFFLLWALDSTTWKNHIKGQVYATSALILLAFLFKYVIMHDFDLKSSDATSLALASDIDLIHKTDKIHDAFDEKYYYQPEARISTPPPSQPTLQTPPETETKEFDLFEDSKEAEKALLIEKNV